jgi:hypothetical protein
MGRKSIFASLHNKSVFVNTLDELIKHFYISIVEKDSFGPLAKKDFEQIVSVKKVSF